MTECKGVSGPEWSRWMKRKQRDDHRQYRFCLNCYDISYRVQPKPIKGKLSRRWRSGVYWIKHVWIVKVYSPLTLDGVCSLLTPMVGYIVLNIRRENNEKISHTKSRPRTHSYSIEKIHPHHWKPYSCQRTKTSTEQVDRTIMVKYYKCPACGKKRLIRIPLRIVCIACRYVNVRTVQWVIQR